MALPATDNFTGADFTFPPSANWTAIDGNLQILSNQCDGVAADGNCDYWNADLFNHDQYSQCVMYGYTESTVGQGGGPAIRLSGTVVGYFANVESTSQITLYRLDGDETYTNLTTITGLSLTSGVSVIRLAGRGSSLRVLVDNVDVGGADDPFYSGGAPGIFIFGSDFKADDWEGGNMPAGGSFQIPRLRPNAFAPGLAR